ICLNVSPLTIQKIKLKYKIYKNNEYKISINANNHGRWCGRSLSENVDNFNIDKLKNLLYFQLKLDKNKRRKKKGDKQIKALYAAANNEKENLQRNNYTEGEYKKNVETEYNDATKEVKNENEQTTGFMSNGIPSGMSNGIPSGMSNGIPSGMSNGIPSGMSNGIPSGMSNGIPSGMPNGIPGGMPNSIQSGMPNANNNDITENKNTPNRKTNENRPTTDSKLKTVINNDQVDKSIQKHEHSINSSELKEKNEDNENIKNEDGSTKIDNVSNSFNLYENLRLLKKKLLSNDKKQIEIETKNKEELEAKENKANSDERQNQSQIQVQSGIGYNENTISNQIKDVNSNTNKDDIKNDIKKDTVIVSESYNKNGDNYDYEKKIDELAKKAKLEQNIPNIRLYLKKKKKKEEIFDITDIIKYVKNILGIKTKIHEKLSHDHLIIKDCNYESFGPDFCSADEEAKQILLEYEAKKNNAFLFIILFTLFFGLLIQAIIHFIEKRVRYSKDQFRKDLLNTTFRQISLITIINITIWGILQSKLSESIDKMIFNDILPKQRNVDEVLHNVEPLIEIIFEKILFISMNFLICYSLFIINIHLVTRRILKWFTESDNCDVSVVIKERRETRKNCFLNYLFFFKYSRNSKYLAHRYDFSESVDAISIPGLDPNGYYYYEYMRACLLKYIVKLIKIPNTVILFLVFACFALRPYFNIRLKAEVIFLNSLALMCAGGLIFLFIYMHRIDRKLLPKNIIKYLLNRYHMDSCEQNINQITPYYKLLKQQSLYPSKINYFLYKTTFPNKHEQLFLFWGNGPAILNFIFQTLCFCFLIILSCWMFLLKVDNITCKTGYLIDTKLLEKVWEFERSDNIKRISEFIDAIKIKSTLHALKEGGDVFWRQLLIKSSTVPSNIQEKMFSIWVSLDEENRGVIDSVKILKFLKSQGINLNSENDVKEFLEVFDRNNKKGLNQEEFFVLIIIVKQILVELLDINAVQSLFEEVYCIPWNSMSSIDVNSLKKILSELNLHWPYGKIRNLIDFVCENKKTKYVSAEYFIKQLINIEEVTLQPFHKQNEYN
ncbi:conserved membrane protein, unknown function, partial [Hepatocystis sp. ex Piliocolobus tephrosceles]